jgi:hypothetical protein
MRLERSRFAGLHRVHRKTFSSHVIFRLIRSEADFRCVTEDWNRGLGRVIRGNLR